MNEEQRIKYLKAEIEKLKTARDKESEVEQTFKNIFDNSSDLIYIHDENGVFIDVNQAVIDKYGFSKKEVVGNTPIIFSAPDCNDLADVAAKTKIVWEGGPPQSLDWWSRKKDGTIFLKELILRKGKYFGRDVIIATGRDITERKEFENKILNQNEELKKLNEALDAFVYSASHDLKAPLLSVKGLLNLMKVDEATKTEHYIEKIAESIDKLTKFVNDLVEYSRNSRTDIKEELIDFRKLIQVVVDNFEFLYTNEKIDVQINVTGIRDFYSDRYRLYIILNNLISNALRYRNTKVQSYVKVNVLPEDEDVRLTVEDNGIGIAQEHQEKIFNMFYRATESETGSGLGLYIVKETVSKLHAEIECHSEVGKGTRFELLIPNRKSQL